MNIPKPNLTFTKAFVSIEPRADEVGVWLGLGTKPPQPGDTEFWLHGAYQIPHDDAIQINTSPLQKALIITCIFDTRNLTRNLVGDVVLFKDDETLINQIHKGYFNYNLLDWVDVDQLRECFVTVSLGKYISNTLRIAVTPSALPR